MPGKSSRKDDKWPAKFTIFLNQLRNDVFDDCQVRQIPGTVFPKGRQNDSHYRVDMQGVSVKLTTTYRVSRL
jgi:hypothetical protein